MHSFGLKMNITELRDYESSNDEIEVDEEINTASKKVKTKRTPKIWLIDRKFASAAEAKKYINPYPSKVFYASLKPKLAYF